MRSPFVLRFTSPLLFVLGFLCSATAPAADSPATPAAETTMPLAMGSAGGVYLLAQPGELTIDVYKRDRNRRGPAVLRAILAGPDRRVIQEVAIPDDGQPRGGSLGPVQQTRLSARVDRAGVYVLNITVSQDRYGDEALWGFATNCDRYMIETSRGHRDQRHEEPIVLHNPGVPGDLCFVPESKSFSIDVTGLPSYVDALTVFDGEGKAVGDLPADAEGRATYTFPAGSRSSDKPWRLHLPVQQATIHIDGVTRWESGNRHPDLSLWTNDPDAYFPLADYRWLLTPYSRLVYAAAGAEGEAVFRVHNNGAAVRTVRLTCEFPDAVWPVEIVPDELALEPDQSGEVTVRYRAGEDGQPRVCHLRASLKEDAEFATYSTLEVRTGRAPASEPLTMPLVLKPYEHENEQFGYRPEYPVDNQVYFDGQNQPFVCTSDGVAMLRGGQWCETSLRSAVQRDSAGGERRHYRRASTKLAFDADNDLYALASTGGQPALLHSTDGGRSFSACEIPAREDGSGSFDLEQFSGHNQPAGPPPILRYTRTASDPKLFWRRLHDLELFVPQKSGDRVTVGEPVLISRKCIGLSSHSGIASTVVSRGGKVHVVWAEATEPEEKVPGVPTYVATYDCSSRQLGKPALVGYGAPPNDVHNTPSITMDSEGYLHVLAGTHGRPFQYAMSLQPNDASGGWTAAVPVGKDLPQTYIGLVCGADDTLHLVYRLWKHGQPPHSASHHATLAWQRKLRGQPWEDPQVLIVPPFSEYSVFYHRLTIDRQGRLFLSYDYWSTFWFYRTDQQWRSRRSLLMSPDGGESWKLVQQADFGQKP